MKAGALSWSRSVSVSRRAIIILVLVAVLLFQIALLRTRQATQEARPPFMEHVQEEATAGKVPSKMSASTTGDLGTLLTDLLDPFPVPTAKPNSYLKTGANETCGKLPGAKKVMLMLKTGATELQQKLPMHLMTTLQCVPNFMIYSDLQQTLGDIPIYDAIAPVSEDTRQKHDEFKLYRELEKWQREGQDTSKLKGDRGWTLDKWKFLPMLHHTFESASDNIEWFVVIEADTSLSWLNLLLWLQTMDPQRPYYLGAQNMIGDTHFAHGGSGIVISRKAADMLKAARYESGRKTYDEVWEERTGESCCGDVVVALAFWAVKIALTPAWPLLQGETVNTVDFTAKHWCTPPVTWHHTTPNEVDSYWQFQLDWAEKHGWYTPYLYRDIFDHFLLQQISANKTSWNNLSNDRKFILPTIVKEQDEDLASLQEYQKQAVASEDKCANACRLEGEGCVQWMYMPGRCHLGQQIRFGRSDELEDEHWNCGWIHERIDAFRKKWRDCSIRWEG